MRKCGKAVWACALTALLMSGGCAGMPRTARLDPKQPVTISVWHYYNGAQIIAFDQLVSEFNETVGQKKGIVVEAHNQGNVNTLEESILASINRQVGSQPLPNLFSTYADTAYQVDRMDYLVDLDTYLSAKDKKEYVDSYLEEGRIGENGELKIFPMAKSTEVMILNKTDWEQFAQATGADLQQLSTKEGVVEAAQAYYEWTDAQTPDVPDDGKAFYGRDAMANLMLIGAKQLGCEIFQVEDGQLTLNLEKDAMRRIWDVSYVPSIKGYFGAYGRFRSDDARVGKIIALVGSTTLASYFPAEVTIEEGTQRYTYPIEALVLPVPPFQDAAEPCFVQQGAGMAVTKATPEEEYASVLFLKWLTEERQNLELSYASGYLPVKKAANSYGKLQEVLKSNGAALSQQAMDTLKCGYETVAHATLYTSKAFANGNEARKILEYSITDLLAADLDQVHAAMAQGKNREDAMAPFLTDAHFEEWYDTFAAQMEKAVKSS